MRFNDCRSHLNPPARLKWADLKFFKPAPAEGMSMVKDTALGSYGGRRYVGSDHFLRIDDGIEFSFRHEAEL